MNMMKLTMMIATLTTLTGMLRLRVHTAAPVGSTIFELAR
jgi:hypothetical protein